MSKQQTAIDWLIEQLDSKGFDLKFNQDVIQQAKQLEKEQIVEACNADNTSYYPKVERNKSAEQYYSDTYK